MTARTPPPDAADSLGGTPSPDAGRDAVHVAVIPATAAVRLLPGMHVGFADGSDRRENAPMTTATAVPWCVSCGVVDPFRRTPVAVGERFWLFLYPKTVTSLRHVWTHPRFDPPADAEEDRS